MKMIEIHKRENYTLIKLNAERLDNSNSPNLKSELVIVNIKGEKNMVLDLINCNYCDSSGLRSVLVAKRLCDDAIGTFILCGLQPDVENLIKISMLDSILLITKTVDEAKDLLEKKENLK